MKASLHAGAPVGSVGSRGVSPAPEPWLCAYGENAWQAPAQMVHDETADPLAIGRFELLEGSAPSYNNLIELDRQLQTITHIAAGFDVAGSVPVPAIALGTKHGNACGAAVAGTPVAATELMLTGDTRAIFGGCVMLGFEVDGAVADTLVNHASPTRRLLDVVAAAGFTEEAIELLARKQGKCRILANPALSDLHRGLLDIAPRVRPVRGGQLEQPNYAFILDLASPDVERFGPALSDAQARDLLLAWAVGSTSNSNTITLVRDGQLLGNGVGQQDRVGGCGLAVSRATDAGHVTAGAVAYSDSFFPFPDGPQILVDAGVSAIFCTSGSVRDDVVREAFLAGGVSVAQLPDPNARGFFGH
jgi:phosphoribosylaminoimidazolecarboxamide formyltransferase/IMP cyclohydrolase